MTSVYRRLIARRLSLAVGVRTSESGSHSSATISKAAMRSAGGSSWFRASTGAADGGRRGGGREGRGEEGRRPHEERVVAAEGRVDAGRRPTDGSGDDPLRRPRPEPRRFRHAPHLGQRHAEGEEEFGGVRRHG